MPIKAPVAGVAMGLDGDYFTILTDIQGLEDALGDMDFKVAGTKNGITAIQMDIKIDGINKEIFKQALAQAKRGREHIMGIMLDCIAEPRKELSKYAPKITTILRKLPPSMLTPKKSAKLLAPAAKPLKRLLKKPALKLILKKTAAYISPQLTAKKLQKLSI